MQQGGIEISLFYPFHSLVKLGIQINKMLQHE